MSVTAFYLNVRWLDAKTAYGERLFVGINPAFGFGKARIVLANEFSVENSW